MPGFMWWFPIEFASKKKYKCLKRIWKKRVGDWLILDGLKNIRWGLDITFTINNLIFRQIIAYRQMLAVISWMPNYRSSHDIFFDFFFQNVSHRTDSNRQEKTAGMSAMFSNKINATIYRNRLWKLSSIRTQGRLWQSFRLHVTKLWRNDCCNQAWKVVGLSMVLVFNKAKTW